MQSTKLKKILKGLLVFMALSSVITVLLINYQVNQFWGGHTEVVQFERFNQTQKKLVIKNVNILSADGQKMIAAQTVLIDGGLIAEIGSEVNINIDSDTQVVDGSGKYLIPGLIDSHVHLWQSPNDLLVYLANGVTHIRELNGSEAHLEWKSAIASGRPGPDMFVATRRHNSQGFLKGWFDRWTAKMNNVMDSGDIQASADSLLDPGFDAIKIYTFLSKEHFQAFNQVAKNTDVKLLGHIPITMELSEVWSSELNELAHIEELVKALSREFGGFNSDSATEFLTFVKQRSGEITTQLIANDMAVVSTLALTERLVHQKHNLNNTLGEVELAYVNPGISESTIPAIRVMGWLPEVNIYRLPEDYPSERLQGNRIYWQTYAQAHQILLDAMTQAGVRILAGTDANVPVMVPGFSIHNELKSMHQAGMNRADVLTSATAAPAEWMDIKTGRIKTGYQADLVLLNNNPLENIEHTKSIQAVMSNGRWYNRTELDDMLSAVEQANDGSRTVPIHEFH